MKPAYWMALIVLVASVAATVLSFSSAVANTVSVKQALAAVPGKTIQVAGKILKESVSYDAVKGMLKFDIVCRQDNVTKMTILYNQPKPENFDTAIDAAGVGTVKGGVLIAKNLLIKCPSKYNDEKAKS